VPPPKTENMTPEKQKLARDILDQILPLEGDFVVGNGVTKQSVLSRDEMLELPEKWAGKKFAKDKYFTPASFKSGTVTRSTGRTQDNVLAARAVWMDIDFAQNDSDKAKSLPTPDQVHDGVSAFIIDVGVRSPSVIHTGGGVHLYWSLSSDISQSEHLALSRSLKEAGQYFLPGWIDSPTTNIATWMRPPGVWSAKNQKEVMPLQLGEPMDPADMSARLEEFLTLKRGHTDAFSAGARPSAPTKHISKVSAALAGQSEGVGTLDGMMGNCAAFRKVWEDPNAVSYDAWWNAACAVKSVQDGGDALNALLERGATNPADDYRRVMGADYKSVGCDKMRACLPESCAGCMVPTPHSGYKTMASAATMTIPVKLISESAAITAGSDTPEIVTQEIRLPGIPFYCGVTEKDGATFFDFTDWDKDIPKQPIGYRASGLLLNGTVRMTSATRQLNSDRQSLYTYIFKVEYPFDDCDSDVVVVTPGELEAQDAVASIRNRCKAEHPKELVRIMKAWIRETAKYAHVEQYNRFGWTTTGKDHKHAFVLGTNMFVAGAPRPKVVALGNDANTVGLNLKAKGSLSAWSAMYNEAYGSFEARHHALASLSAFGAPLVDMTAINGAVIALHGQGGVGKTMLQRICASIWGSPDAVTGANRTENFDDHIRGVYNNLPTWVDDVNNKDTNALSRLAYSAANGSGRARMSKDATMRDTVTWRNLHVISSNVSLVTNLRSTGSNEAEADRILELTLPEVSGFSVDRGPALERNLSSNYGLAGQVYAQYLVDNRQAVQDELDECILAFSRENPAGSMRFIISALATMIVGGRIANKLGLIKVDMAMMNVLAREKVSRVSVANMVARTTVVDMLSQFLLHNRSGLARVINGDPTNATVDGYGDIVARVDKVNRVIAVSVNAFDSFLSEKGGSRKTITEIFNDLTSIGVRRTDSTTAQLTLGTIIPSGPVRAYTFKVPQEWVNGFPDAPIVSQPANLEVQFNGNPIEVHKIPPPPPRKTSP
jgi:Domain of unknown function (DUF927)